MDKVHFYVPELKSVIVTDTPDNVPLSARIKPKGDFYFYNPNIELKDDDWVIYGVASTPHVDLSRDIIDVKEVFGDYLDEFVRTGKIFYEHGYRHAGDVSGARIDEPIGVPYLVEIVDNELWIYAVLDKTHPLAKKVWESFQNGDSRFSRYGFSIGAMPLGKPQTVFDPKYGTIKKAPKMRLYEISVTPQPVNPYTWAQVLKSLLSEEDMPDKEKKEFEKETVSTDPKDLPEAPEVEMGGEGAEGSPPAETAPLDEAVTKAVEEEEKPEAEEETKEEEKEAEEANEAAEEAVEKVMEAAEEKEEEKEEEEKPAEEEKAEEKPADEGEGGNLLMDLLGGEEEEKAEEEEEDLAADLLNDKLDALKEQLDMLMEKVNKLSDALAKEEGEEVQATPEAATPLEKSVIEEQTKVLKSLAEKLDYALDKLDELSQENAALKSLIAELEKKVEEEEVVKSVSETETDPVEEARKDFQPEAPGTPVTKSVASIEEEVAVVEEEHPAFKSVEAEVEPQDPLTRLITDPELRESFAEVVEVYKSLEAAYQDKKLTGDKYAVRRREIIKSVRNIFGLSEEDFLKLVR